MRPPFLPCSELRVVFFFFFSSFFFCDSYGCDAARSAFSVLPSHHRIRIFLLPFDCFFGCWSLLLGVSFDHRSFSSSALTVSGPCSSLSFSSPTGLMLIDCSSMISPSHLNEFVLHSLFFIVPVAPGRPAI